jgi:hypothetical protein
VSEGLCSVVVVVAGRRTVVVVFGTVVVVAAFLGAVVVVRRTVVVVFFRAVVVVVGFFFLAAVVILPVVDVDAPLVCTFPSLDPQAVAPRPKAANRTSGAMRRSTLVLVNIPIRVMSPYLLGHRVLALRGKPSAGLPGVSR